MGIRYKSFRFYPRAHEDTRKLRRILLKLTLTENFSGQYEMYPEESPLVYAAFIQIRGVRWSSTESFRIKTQVDQVEVSGVAARRVYEEEAG